MDRGRIAFSNAHMFDKVMLNENICRMFLERVLGLQVDEITYRNAEQVLEPRVDAHGVRLDLFVKTPNGVFDIEMEAEPRGALGRRLRYYQASIDTSLLDRGEDYWTLPNSFVIFLCKYDPFGHGLPVYNMRMCCDEAAGLDVGCGMQWIALNSTAYSEAASESMRNLLEYVQKGKPNLEDALVKAIDDAVDEANHDRKWVDKVFSVSTIEEDIRREARYRIEMAEKEATERGLQQGMEQGLEQGLQQGLQQGEEHATQRAAQQAAQQAELVRRLLADERLDELSQQLDDMTLRQKLYEEYGL